MIAFSIPNTPSFTSITPDTGETLFVPDIKYLTKFVNGEIGINEGITKKSYMRNIGKTKSVAALDIFLKTTGSTLRLPSQQYLINGKIQVPPQDLTLGTNYNNLGGLLAMEKSMVQSIFETQKPYIEIVKLIIENFVKIEDIIARVSAIGGKSLKPSGNPRALGYAGRTDVTGGIYSLDKLTSLGTQANKTDSNQTIPFPLDSTTQENTSGKIPNNYVAITQSIVYSTGNYEPNVKYTYIYKDEISDNIVIPTDGTASIVLDNPNDDLGKPNTVVLTVFDSNFNLVDNDTIKNKLNFLNISDKYHDQWKQITIGSDYNYVWVKNGYPDYVGVNPPTNQTGYSIKQDSTGANVLAISNDTNNIINLYYDFYTNYTNTQLSGVTNSSTYSTDLINQLKQDNSVEISISYLISNGFLPFGYNKMGLSDSDANKLLKNAKPYKPGQINGTWIDPENDYDFKLIKVVPVYDTSKDNSYLNTTNPYSSGLYGTPTDSQNQTIDSINRYVTDKNDTDVFYIVEGVLSSTNQQPFDIGDGNAGQANNASGNRGYYRIKDVFKAIKVFIRMLVDVFSKLIPAIEDLISIIKNPVTFLTDKIIAKLGDNNGSENIKFGIFSKDFLNELKKIFMVAPDLRKKYASSTILKNYVFVGVNGAVKFLVDGSASIKLFGDAPSLSFIPSITFGLESYLSTLATSKPKVPIQVFFEKIAQNTATNTNATTNNLANPTTASPNTSSVSANQNNIPNISPTNVGDDSSNVSITYSTGTYKSNVNYTYIYVTQYIASLINEAQKYEDGGDYARAMDLLRQAQLQDPNNEYISDKMNEISKKAGSTYQPILGLILNMVALPLKVVYNIIAYVLDFFKSLTNPFTLAGKIVDFLKFEWILDFFSPTSKNGILSMLGLVFDIPTLTNWITNIDTINKDEFDMNDVFKMPWSLPLPKYSKKQFKAIISGGTSNILAMINSILCLIEAALNGIIDFIWALFGLGAIIPQPYLKICKDTNSDLSAQDIMDLLNGNYKDKTIQSFPYNEADTSNNYNFVYDIKTSDGRDLKDLNLVELQQWIEQNKNLQFIFNL